MFLILGLVFIALSILCFFFVRHKAVPIIAAIVGVVLLGTSLFITQVPTGYTGVLTTFGKVEDVALNSGINVKMPWQKVVLMDNREQRATFSFNAFSSDIQQTTVAGSINYRINPETAMSLFKSVGTNYVNTLITPRLYENMKIVFGQYNAENLISQRNILAEEVLALMKEDLEEYGITIVSIAIEDIDFTDAFTNAIEAKQVATQDKLRAQTVQEQATMEAEAQAERAKISAEAEAEVARIEAEADAYAITTRASAEAEANAKINASLTPELIDYVQANNWNGELPTTFMGSETGAVPILDITE